MKLRLTQFGVRENTASSGQHASRLAKGSVPLTIENLPRSSHHRKQTLILATGTNAEEDPLTTKLQDGSTERERGCNAEPLHAAAPTLTALNRPRSVFDLNIVVRTQEKAFAPIGECPLTVRDAAKYLGVVYRRHGTNCWWMRYRERDGSLRKESTLTKDWHDAQKKLRDRLQARDGNFLNIVRKGENLDFGQWVDFFLENYSKPPGRELKTHEANIRAAKHLKFAFATRSLIDVTADDIELFLRERLRQLLKRRRPMVTAYGERSNHPQCTKTCECFAGS